ncbi:recombinase family protein [Gemmata sp.]|uniref:recombinase family protein n=1 Tax=Gemmata sp. TaxID=1914242 RepID=UPI003F71E7A2
MRSVAYSYNRFSSPQQADGDSIRRQTALARAWCQRHGYTLDVNATYEDRGKSGYHGKHRGESGMLKRFLDDVESGHIPRESVLLIENMDRLSREKPVVGVNVLTGILLAGVRIVQLSPDEIELTEDSDLFSLFRGQMSQARGHDESKTKAARMAAVWGERQRLAREKGERVTTRLPGWLEIRGGRLEKTAAGRAKTVGGTIEMIPQRVRIVREMFRLAIDGYGLGLIVKHLSARGFESWGPSGAWSKAYVRKILTSPAVLGEYQPRKGGKSSGGPVTGYYPEVIDRDTFARVGKAMEVRKDKPGRVGAKSLSLFSGLLWEAKTGQKLHVSNQSRGPKGKRSKRRVIVTAGSMEGRAASVGFPLDVFEPAVLSRLSELNPADVLGAEPEGEAATIAAELARVKASVAALVADLEEHGDSPAVLKRLREKEAAQGELARRLAAARVSEKHPRSASFAEAKTLMAAARDEAGRLRLRQLLRNSIDRVTVLVVPRKSRRVAVVQIDFEEGSRRSYLIHYQTAGRGREGGWEVFAVKDAVASATGFDLRNPDDAAAMERLVAMGMEAEGTGGSTRGKKGK